MSIEQSQGKPKYLRVQVQVSFNARAGCEATMVSLLDYYYMYMVLVLGYNWELGEERKDEVVSQPKE